MIEDFNSLEEEPLEPEITVRRTGAEEGEPASRGWGGLIPEMSETTARVVVAIPWGIFAIAIVAVGGLVFTLALIVMAILGVREFFRMADPEQPFFLPAYVVVAGMVLAAHYGSAFQILLVFAAIFPLAFAFAAARRSHEAITVSIAMTILGVAWMGIGFSHPVLLPHLPLPRGALLTDVLVRTSLV